MRRSTFYMGRSFTQRHINAVASPLLTGYIAPRPRTFCCAAASLAHQALLDAPSAGALCSIDELVACESLLTLSVGAMMLLGASARWTVRGVLTSTSEDVRLPRKVRR